MSAFEHLRPLFASESERILGTMDEAFNTLQRDPGDEAARTLLCMGAHTLKGSASVMSFDDVARFADLIQRTMGCFEGEPRAFDSQVEAHLREMLDLTKQLVAEVAQEGDPIADRGRMAELEGSTPPDA